MGADIQEILSGACTRPRHFEVNRWYDHVGLRSAQQISYRPSKQDNKILKQKIRRRLEQWWPKDDAYPKAPSSKFLEAKRQRFTKDQESERVSKSLAALKQPSRIKLTSEQWRQLVEDHDLEDQSI